MHRPGRSRASLHLFHREKPRGRAVRDAPQGDSAVLNCSLGSQRASDARNVGS